MTKAVKPNGFRGRSGCLLFQKRSPRDQGEVYKATGDSEIAERIGTAMIVAC